MEPALAVTRAIDELNRRIGIVAIYLVLFASLVSAFNAIFRYSTNGIMWLERHVGGGFFGGIIDIYRQNSNTLSESQWYMFAGMVMLGGAWTLKVNEHVRVDLRLWLGQRAHANVDRPARRHLLPAADVRPDDLFHLAMVHAGLGHQ